MSLERVWLFKILILATIFPSFCLSSKIISIDLDSKPEAIQDKYIQCRDFGKCKIPAGTFSSTGQLSRKNYIGIDKQIKAIEDQYIQCQKLDTCKILAGTFSSTSHFSPKTSVGFGRIKRSIEVCRKMSVCKANEGFDFNTCYCDHYCKYFGDCCIDANATSEHSIVPDKSKYISCVQFVSLQTFSFKANHGMRMVSKCPSRSTSNIAYKCEQSLDDIHPVTDPSGLTYKNKHCAMCHDVNNFSFWSLMVSLKSCGRLFEYASINSTNAAERIAILKEQGCKMYYVPAPDYTHNKKLYARLCINDVKADFIDKEQKNCRNIYIPFYDDKKKVFISNVYCVKNISIFEITCLTPSTWNSEKNLQTWEMKPMTVLFQFKSYDNQDEKETCGNNDGKTKKSICIPWACRNNISEEICIEEAVNSYRMGFKLHMESDNIYNNTFERALFMFWFSLPMNHYHLFLDQTSYYQRCKKENGTQYCCFSSQVNIVILKKMTHEELRNFRSSILNMNFKYQEKLGNNIYTVQKIPDKSPNQCMQNRLAQQRNYITMNTMLKYADNLDTGQFQINHTEVPEISEVKIQVGTNFVDENIPIFFKVLDWFKTFPNKKITENSNPSIDIQTIFTYLTMGVSSLALGFALGLFIYFKLYTTLADQLCLNLICTLLFANLLFMFGIGVTDYSIVCYIIGITLHFLWLSMFTWVTVFAVIFTVTIAKIENNLTFDADKDWSKCPIYFAGYGTPIVFIVSSLSINEIWSDLHIKYNDKICFPSGFPGNIIFFSAPVVLSVVINVFLLLITSKFLQKHYVNTLVKSTRLVVMYTITFLKLALFSGVFWVFGVLAQALENEILAFIFIILCGSQGLVFSICFVCSTRIKRKIYANFHRSGN